MIKYFGILALLGVSLFGAHNGVVTGSPTFSAGKFGNGVGTLNGSNYIALPSGTFSKTTTSSWTIEAQVKISSCGAAYCVAVGMGSALDSVWLGVSNTGNFMASVVGTGGFSAIISSSQNIMDGNWHHVALVITSGTQMALYTDGILRASVSGAITAIGDTGNIGNLPAAASTYYWNGGMIDELAFWNVAKYVGASFVAPTAAYTGGEANLGALYHCESDGTDSAGTLAPPGAGTLSSGAITSTTVALSMTAATGGTSPYTYQLQRSPSGCGAYVNQGSALTGQTGAASWTDSTVSASTGYCYRVVITDATSVVVNSNAVTVTTGSATLNYTRIDAFSPRTGQPIMILVPSGTSPIPYVSSNPTNVVIYSHGAGETADAWLTDALKASTRTALLDAGYILAGTSARGDNWGTQTAADDYADLYRYILNNYNVNKTVLYAQSMGGLNGAQNVAFGKIPFVGAVFIYPVLSLSNLYSLGTYTGAINTAHGITGTGTATYTNMTFGLDPALMTAISFRHIPMRFYASYGDGVVPRANNTDAFASLVASSTSEAVVVSCTGNHGDPSHFQPSDVLSFFSRAISATLRTSGLLGVGGGVSVAY